MSAQVLLNLLNRLKKLIKCKACRNEFNKFNKTGVRMLDFIYHMTLKCFFCNHVCGAKRLDFAIHTRRCYGHRFITLHVPESL